MSVLAATPACLSAGSVFTQMVASLNRKVFLYFRFFRLLFSQKAVCEIHRTWKCGVDAKKRRQESDIERKEIDSFGDAVGAGE